MPYSSHKPLFGGNRAWNPQEWTSTDDRVRGGSSYSTLNCSPGSLVAKFEGNLDISTLGGAGFASQRTTREVGSWDVSNYDGLELMLDQAVDEKVYTIILKDTIHTNRPGEQERGINWEYDFRARSGKVFIKWDEFKPTFRGRPVEDTRPLDLKAIKRFSIMARSFFGKQQGDFSLRIISISALRVDRYFDDPDEGESLFDEKLDTLETREPEGWLRWLAGCFRC